jgi:hypothetical protein
MNEIQKRKRGQKPKSTFYHIRWHTVGLNEERAAEVIGVPIDVIRQWDKDGAPMMAEQLLLFWDSKHIGLPGWEGFMFSRGILRFKNRRWTPKTILEYRDQAEEIYRLKNELERLKTWRGLSKVFVEKLIDELRKRQRRRRPRSF